MNKVISLLMLAVILVTACKASPKLSCIVQPISLIPLIIANSCILDITGYMAIAIPSISKPSDINFFLPDLSDKRPINVLDIASIRAATEKIIPIAVAEKLFCIRYVGNITNNNLSAMVVKIDNNANTQNAFCNRFTQTPIIL